MSLKNRTLYWIKNHPTDSTKCNLCGYELGSCHIGQFCTNDKCQYVDGVAWLTDKQAIKFKDKIIEPYKFPKLNITPKLNK